MDVSVARGSGVTIQLALMADGQPFALLSTATTFQYQAVYQTDLHNQLVLAKYLANVYLDTPTLGTVSVPILPSDTQVMKTGSYFQSIQVTTPLTTYNWRCSDMLNVLDPLKACTPPIPTAGQLATAFATLDVNMDNLLSFTEFLQLPYVQPPVLYIPWPRTPDQIPTSSQLQTLFTLLDTNGDGMLTLAEFQQLPYVKPALPPTPAVPPAYLPSVPAQPLPPYPFPFPVLLPQQSDDY